MERQAHSSPRLAEGARSKVQLYWTMVSWIYTRPARFAITCGDHDRCALAHSQTRRWQEPAHAYTYDADRGKTVSRSPRAEHWCRCPST